MGKNDKAPDSVSHKIESGVPFDFANISGAIGGPEIHTTTIHKDGNTYTGTGWTKEEANQSAGEKYSHGDKDKK